MTTKEKTEFTKEESESLRVHVADQIRLQTDACLGVAEALFRVRYGTIKGTATPIVVAWNYPDFETYVEKDLLWHGGTARSYVRVYDELCNSRNFAVGELPASITALRELAKVSRKYRKEGLPKSEFDAWVKRSKKLTACQLQAEVEKEIYGKARKMRTVGFALPLAAANRIRKWVKEAREGYGLSTNGEAVDRIFSDWAVKKETASERRKRAG